MPSPVTYPIGPYISWLIRLAAAGFTIYENFFTGGVDEKTTVETLPHWHRVVFDMSRAAPTGLEEDHAQFKFDMLRNDATGPLDTWTTTNFTDAETALDAFWVALQQYVPQTHTLLAYRWYRMSFAPTTSERPFGISGPPVRVLAKNLAGTGTNYSPYQIAATITWKTALPRHWGRTYLPFDVGTTHFTSGGRIASAAQDALGLAAKNLYDALHTANLNLCIPITQLDKAHVRGLLGIDHIRVDDVPDVQRRRRAKRVNRRYITPV